MNESTAQQLVVRTWALCRTEFLAFAGRAGTGRGLPGRVFLRQFTE
jgi:hypothetical protein